MIKICYAKQTISRENTNYLISHRLIKLFCPSHPYSTDLSTTSINFGQLLLTNFSLIFRREKKHLKLIDFLFIHFCFGHNFYDNKQNPVKCHHCQQNLWDMPLPVLYHVPRLGQSTKRLLKNRHQFGYHLSLLYATQL